MEAEANLPRRLSAPVLVVGYLIMLATVILAARILWEKTWLTWKQGPQMVGFSLAHGSAAPLLLSPVLLLLWLLPCVVVVLVWVIRQTGVARSTWIALAAAVLSLGLLSVPQPMLDWLFASQLAHSPRAAELFVYAAGMGEQSVITRMMHNGVQPGVTDDEGNTALHTASAAGHTGIVQLLLDAHAPVNAVNLYGDSPLARATENHQEAAIKLLQAHGAQLVEGTEEQRQEAIRQIVRRQMEPPPADLSR